MDETRTLEEIEVAEPDILEDTKGIQEYAIEYFFSRPYPLWKRITDIFFSIIALIVFSPVFLITAVLIKLTSKGPVIFSQQRAGYQGVPFNCHKFRTMVAGADARKKELMEFNERKGPAFKMADDPRITKIGKYLRKLSFDELPQIFNVLKGEMSIVGPRPLPVEEDGATDSWHKVRRMVKPGITCYWQVTSRDEDDFDNWARLDIKYVQSFSFWVDLKIILQTFSAVISRKGAV